jgi:hypothetical protein
MKQNAFGFLGITQDKANETAGAAEKKSKQAKDSATCTWNSTKDKASNTVATAQDIADSTLKSTKEQTDAAIGATSTRSKEGGTATRDPPELPEEHATIVEIKAFKDWNQGACIVCMSVYRHYDWAHTRCSYSSRSMEKLGANVPNKYKGKEAAAKARAAHYGEEEHVYQ